MSSKNKNIWLRIAKQGRTTADGSLNYKVSKKSSINVYTTNKPVNHWKITKIADDVWLDILMMLDWKDFIKVKGTCHHFNHLGSNKNSGRINRFWERESNKLCRSIEETYETRRWDEFYINLHQFLRANKYTRRQMVILKNYWLALFESCVKTPNVYVFEMISAKFDDNTWFSMAMKGMKGKINDGSYRYYQTSSLINQLNEDNTVIGEILRLSMIKNNLTMVKYILNRWPNAVNLIIKDGSGDGCLHTLISFVTKCLNDELICLVLNHPSFDERALIVKNSKHNLPFHNVFYYNNKHSNLISMDTLELLMNKTNDAYATYHNRTDMEEIYGNGVDELMQVSNVVNETGGTNNNLTPLMLAVLHEEGSRKLGKRSPKHKTANDVAFLLSRGGGNNNNNTINVNQRCFENKKTALMYAAEVGNLKAVQLLLDKNMNNKLPQSKKTNIAFKDKNEQTVFHYAAKSGDVKLLLCVYNYVKSICYDYFRNVNPPKTNSNSLYGAYGISKTAKFQNKGKGKNKNKNKRKGNKDYDVKDATANMKARQWLLEYVNAPAGDDKKTPYIMACEKQIKDFNFFKTLIDVCNVDISIKDKFGRVGSSYCNCYESKLFRQLAQRESRRMNKI